MTQFSPIFTDFDIQALIDNELSWEEEKKVRKYLRENVRAKERYLELKKQKELLQKWWQQRYKD